MAKITKIRTNQRKAIEAMLEGKSADETAEAAGVSRTAVFKWLQEETFQAALLEQTRIVHGHVMARLIGSMDLAVNTLRSGCDGDANATQVRAANAIIGNAVTLGAALDQEARLQDALERLAALEQRRKSQDGRQSNNLPVVRTWAS